MKRQPNPHPKIRSAPRGYVRVRPMPRGGFIVSIPKPIGNVVGPDRLFKVELVDEGILLRYIEGGEPVNDRLPSWLTS